MSSIVISGNTSGSVTLSAPAVAGNTVLNLPTSSGTLSTGGVGEGQTWQDVTASRALATTYTNSTGKPIMVLFMGGASVSNCTYRLIINSVELIANVFPSFNQTVSYIIPTGSTYSITMTNGGISKWIELR